MPEDVEVFIELARSDPALPRVGWRLVADPDHWREQRPAFLAAREQARTAGTADRVKVETIKFFADGVIESGTAALIDEYSDHPGYRGIPNWTPAGLAEAVAAFDEDGFQIHIHAIGDAGIRNALDAIEAMIARNGERDRRPTIAHTQLVQPDDLPRFAAPGGDRQLRTAVGATRADDGGAHDSPARGGAKQVAVSDRLPRVVAEPR